MKKHYLIGTLIAATALVAAAQAATSLGLPQHRKAVAIGEFPSHPALGDDQFAEGWTINNANGDDVKWLATKDYDVNEFIAKCNYTPRDGGPMDDYLLSPSVSLNGGEEYTITMKYKMGGWSDSDNLKVFVTTSTDPEVIKTSEPIFVKEQANVQPYQVETMKFTPESDGDYHVVFYCYSDEFQGGVCIMEVNVVGKVSPNPVIQLTALPAADKSISCTLSWTLPTTNNAGGALGTIEKVVVFRDDVQIAELDGTATSFTDTEAEGLTAGEHTYAVMVVVDGVESEKAEVTSPNIGPLEPKELPTSFSFASEADFNNWVVIKGDASTNSSTWNYNNAQHYAGYSVTYSYYTQSTDDDWLIAPPVKVDEAGYFKVIVSGVKSSWVASNFELVMGTAPTTEMSAVGEAFDLPYEANNPDFTSETTHTEIEIYLEPGTYYFGLHNRLGSNFTSSNTYKIGGIGFENSQFYPGEVSNVKAVGAADFSKTLEVSWTNPTTDCAGQPMAGKAFTINVYVGDSETPSKVITDGATSCSIDVDAEGAYSVTIVTETEDGASLGRKVTVKSGWVGFPFVELPYSTTFDPESDSKLDIWRANIIDGNADGKTFEIKNYPEVSYLETIYGAREYEDYALSPYMALGVSICKVEFDWVADSYNDIILLAGLIEAGSFDKTTIGEAEFISTRSLPAGARGTYSNTFVVPAAGNYQFVIGHLGSNTYGMDDLRITRFEVMEDVTYPGDVENLAVAADPDDESKAIVSWTNPTTYFESEDALESLEAIVVLRDGELVGTVDDAAKLVPGAECTFTDVLDEGGLYTYTVYPTVNGRGHGGVYPTVTSSWVGGGLASLDMDADDERWSFVDAHGDFDAESHKYGWCQHKPYSQTYLYYWHDGAGDNEADDYLVTPPVRVTEGNVYEVSVSVLPNIDADSKAYNASVKMGIGSDAEAWEHVHAINIAADASNTAVVTHKFNVAVGSTPAAAPRKVEGEDDEEEVDVAKALYDGAVKLAGGSHTIAIHATEVGGMRIANLTFKKVAEYTPVTTGLENVAVADFVFDGHTVSFAGVADVEVYDLAGACVHRVYRCNGTCELPHLSPGIYFIRVNDRVQKFIAE